MVNKAFHFKKIIIALIMVLVFGMTVYGDNHRTNRNIDRLIGTWEIENPSSSRFVAKSLVFYSTGRGRKDGIDFNWELHNNNQLRIESNSAGIQWYTIELKIPGLFSREKRTLTLNSDRRFFDIDPTTYIKK